MDRIQNQPPNIFSEQNSEYHLRLLAAQKQLYSEAKVLRRCRALGSVLLALGAPFILHRFPGSVIGLNVAGGIALVLDFLLVGVEERKIKEAATIQEEFDTSLFALPWNQRLVGVKVMPEEISLVARRFKGDQQKIYNWYSDTGAVAYPLNVLLCQRTNLAWDWNLRRLFATLLFIVPVVYVIALVVFAIVNDQLVSDFLLALVLPALSAILESFRDGRKHLAITNDKREAAASLLEMIERGAKNPRSVSKKDCRSIQDCIFIQRRDGPLVPNWLYNLKRSHDEQQMYSTTAELVAEIEKIKS